MNSQSCEWLIERFQAEPHGRLLGMEVVEVGPGSALVRIHCRPAITNMFGGTHGGALFSLIDEAVQLDSHTRGVLSVALSVTITYVAAPTSTAVLEALAREIHMTKRTASYSCEVRETTNGTENKLVATAQALAYRTGKELDYAIIASPNATAHEAL
jgi:acyl-CoA thioesterase